MWRRHLRDRLTAPFAGVGRRAGAGGKFDPAHLVRRPRGVNEATIRSLCRATYLGDGDVLARVLGRYKMFLDSRDVGMSSHLMLDGFWEMWLTQAMAAFVRPGMVVADVGANLGYYTLLMGDLVGASGHVHAFEPNAALVDRLRRSVGINLPPDRATIHALALGEDDRGAEMVVPLGEPKNGSVVPTGARHDAIAVATARMDAIDALAAVDLVKIDVEGAEEAVWRGMAGILARGRPLTVFLEFTAERYPDAGAFVDAILADGFSLAVIELSGAIVPLTRAALLARPRHEDQMLLLRR